MKSTAPKLPGKFCRVLSFIPWINWLSVLYIGIVNTNALHIICGIVYAVVTFAVPSTAPFLWIVGIVQYIFAYRSIKKRMASAGVSSARPQEMANIHSPSPTAPGFSDMKEIARKRQEKDIFFVHHGSVSAALRQEAEAALRDREGPTVAAATLTLELGIDIGDLDSTIQIGAPYSCTSFVQRLGRSGRRSGKSQMMFLELLEASERNAFEQLPWTLLRAIAIIQLYLEESWVEPFTLKPKPFSLLAHQTLSTLMTYGELSPPELARSCLLLPAFRKTITQDEYRLILRYMIAEDYLQRVENGAIIVGIRGERITNHYSFYAVFQDEQAYHAVSPPSKAVPSLFHRHFSPPGRRECPAPRCFCPC